MKSFFFLLFFGATASKIVSANNQQVCDGPTDAGNYFVNFCEEKCVCEEVNPGEWDHVCYRERQEFTCMSKYSRQRFLDTYKAVTTPGHPQFEKMAHLIEMHENDPDNPSEDNFSLLHNNAATFLPWHRYYAMAVEDVLRNEDCRVTLPWWRWSKKSHMWWIGSPFLSPTNWLGTDSNMACVNDGPFGSAVISQVPTAWWDPPVPQPPTCLRRNFFNPTNTLINAMPSIPEISNVLATHWTNWNLFTEKLEGIIHNLPHVNIGGDMVTRLSPREPTFFLHHGYIDKLWDDWQNLSPGHLTSYANHDMTAPLPATFGTTPSNVDDHFNLKASRVMYDSSGFCNLVVWFSGTKLSHQKFFDIEKIENAILKDAMGEQRLREVPQIKPKTLSFDELKEMFSWWYEGVQDREATNQLDEKIALMVNQLQQSADAVENPITSEELARLNNPASIALGIDLDSDEFTEILLDAQVCQEGWDFHHKKGKCVKNRSASRDLVNEIEAEGAVIGCEVVNKEDAEEIGTLPFPPDLTVGTRRSNLP